MTYFGVRGWDFHTALGLLDEYLADYGTSFVDGVFVDSSGFGWASNEMVEAIARRLIPTTAEIHFGNVSENGDGWTWEMTHDSLWEWEIREGCTTDYVGEMFPTWERLERHEVARLVGMAMRYVANDHECLMAMELEMRSYDVA
jgi:hypothetical protein